MTDLCDIDADEMEFLDLPPIRFFPRRGRRRVSVTVFLMYAVQPPPDGPLEDADIEDEEDLYDWYTFPRAMEAFRSSEDFSSM